MNMRPCDLGARSSAQTTFHVFSTTQGVDPDTLDVFEVSIIDRAHNAAMMADLQVWMDGCVINEAVTAQLVRTVVAIGVDDKCGGKMEQTNMTRTIELRKN